MVSQAITVWITTGLLFIVLLFLVDAVISRGAGWAANRSILLVLRWLSRLFLAIVATLFVPITVLELVLRRWSQRPLLSVKRSKAGFSTHGSDAVGSWTLSSHVMALRDPSFDENYWKEHELQSAKMSVESWRPLQNGPIIRRIASSHVGIQFNISEGERFTSDRPASFQNHVFCFGGSTTFCTEVPDRSTWPSCLQRCLNAGNDTAAYRSRNLGIPGTPGLERILTLRHATILNPRDVAVFLFGDNDSGWKMYGTREGKYSAHLPKMIGLLRRGAEVLELAGWLYAELAPRYLRRLAVEMAETTIAAAEEAAKFAQSRGANVLFVLQPNIFTLARPDDWDRKIIAGTARDLPIMLAAAYERYRTWLKTSPIAVDATHIFNDEIPSPYMGDWGHVNTRGNQLIGEFIFAELDKRGLLAAPTSVI